MLVVKDIWAKGRHHPLFGPTSFDVDPGEVIIIQADSQLERTALSLTLTGRMKPSGGKILIRDSDTGSQHRIHRKELRKRSEIIDSPGVNEPENFMRVHDYVSEMRSYTMSAFARPQSGLWLKEHNLQDLENLWVEQVNGTQRTQLMSALASSYPQADLLVFDTPSRHLNHTRMWLPYLQELAEDPEHPRVVVAVVPHISSAWHGKSAVVGSAHDEFDQTPNDEETVWEEALPPGSVRA